MNDYRKPVEDAMSCSECERLHDDNGTLRCMMFDGAIIKDTTDKHCKDSIR